MGQQVPFETLDQVARGLCKRIESPGTTVARTARTVRVGCEMLQRLELDVRFSEGKRQAIHLYEAYWAPLTEGVAGLRQVLRFLLSGAINGLRSDARLHRFMFDRPRQFHVSRWHLVLLGAVVITLIGVLIIGGTISGGAIARLLLPHNGLVDNTLIADLSSLFELLLAVVAGAAAVAVVLVAVSRGVRSRHLKRISALTALPVLLVMFAIWLSAYVAIPVIVAFNEKPFIDAHQCKWCPDFVAGISGPIAAAAARLANAAHRLVDIVLRCGRPEFLVWLALAGAGVVWLVYAVLALRSPNGAPRRRGGRLTAVVLALLALAGILTICGHGDALAYVTWLLLFGAVLFVRLFLIQFIGDVAIYVSPHKVDRFFDVRMRIKSVVRRTARAVFACRDDEGQFLYDGVVVVGHSLGSVVVYDVLNRLINEDGLSDGATPVICDDEPIEDLQIAERTRLLLTFGSPLDKTAFVFAQHDLAAESERDTLATACQPLIAHERKFDWVNLWSRFDILGGHLDYYDTPDRPNEPEPNQRRVCNRVDPDAITPFAAHTEFWNNTLLYDEIYKAL